MKLRDIVEPVEVDVEHRAAARHYAKCVTNRHHGKGEIYRAVEWARLKRD